jgi:hypothetical protein
MVDGLLGMWASRTIDEAYDVLAQPDVTVTNASDKTIQLAMLHRLHSDVKEALSKPAVPTGMSDAGGEGTAEGTAELHAEVAAALRENMPMLLVHEQREGHGAVDFDTILTRTPPDLRQLGLYSGTLAVPLYDGEEYQRQCLRVMIGASDEPTSSYWRWPWHRLKVGDEAEGRVAKEQSPGTQRRLAKFLGFRKRRGKEWLMSESGLLIEVHSGKGSVASQKVASRKVCREGLK